MSVVEMSKIKLIGLFDHKEDILNALHKTGCVELTATEEIADTFIAPKNDGASPTAIQFEKIKATIDFFEERLEKCKKKDFYPTDTDFLKYQLVTYEQFIGAKNLQEKVEEILAKISQYKDTVYNNKSETLKLNNLLSQLSPYALMCEKFSDFINTKTTSVFLGTIKAEALTTLQTYIEENPLTELKVMCSAQQTVISIIAFNQCVSDLEQRLVEVGFNKCAFDFDCTAGQKIKEIERQISNLDKANEQIDRLLCQSIFDLKDLRIYSDYLKFIIEKQMVSEEFRRTNKTFVLQGYLPKEKQEQVDKAVQSVTNAVFIEYSQPTKEDNPPTLLKNKRPIKQSEFVVDMYSAPDYREVDPNKVVFLFFMLFMGVIMADVAYGLSMIFIGWYLARKIKVDNGSKRLWSIIAFSGIPTIIFGILFNSFLGFALPYNAILPSPVPDGSTESLNNLMIILLACLGLGVLHMAMGYFLKALNMFKQKDVFGGICEGLVWVVFFIGLIFATFNFLLDYLLKDFTMNAGLRSFFAKMTMPGIIMVGASVFIAMVTAGRKEKGFGKFTKGFGSVYGIINIMSDILSYARLFGLMLSGMIIASTFNDMGTGMFGGVGGYIVGVLIIIVGHVFNIAMGVLGAYIHNSRLQYIEFFGKFYKGEGNQFTPLGSKMDYVYITEEVKQ